MIKSRDKEWLKEEAFKLYPSHVEMYEFPDDLVVLKKEMADAFVSLVDQLDEPEKTLEQEAVDELIKKYSKDEMSTYDVKVEREKFVKDLQDLLVPKQQLPVVPQFVADWIESLPENVKLHTIFNVKNHSYEEAQHWVWRNSELFARAWLYGYEVEKEILWEIPMPYLVTSDGHIQYLTYDPKAKTYFASKKSGRLKQTFNAKDLASVPEKYRRYAELCDFKKIEREAE